MAHEAEQTNQEDTTVVVRTFAPTEWRLYRDLRLRALLDAPDAFGSTYAHECQLTDADWRVRLSRGAASGRDSPLLAEVQREPSGLAWVRTEGEAPTVAHLYQMWVAPEHRGHGVGRALVEAAVDWARTAAAHALILDVTLGNSQARRLYEQAGFVQIGSPKPLRPGSTLQSVSLRLSLAAGSGEASA